MTIEGALRQSGIKPAEGEILLGSVLGQSRAWLLAHAGDQLTEKEEAAWLKGLERRRGGEPLAYITGRKEFYGRMFNADRRALIPRSCTEALIDDVKKFLHDPHDSMKETDEEIVSWTHVLKKEKPVTIVDIGTGSGCIAITLALELPKMKVIATDLSSDALTLAKENAKKLNASITFLEGNLLEPIKNIQESFLLVSNPPYISEDSNDLQEEVRKFEPALAFFAEDKGKAIIRGITDGAKAHPFCVGWIMECPKNLAS